MRHKEPHPLAGQTIKIKPDTQHPQNPDFGGSAFRLEDWWDRVAGESWMTSTGNPACLVYAMRTAIAVPIDDEVVYGKVGNLGHLLHVSELDIPVSDAKTSWHGRDNNVEAFGH